MPESYENMFKSYQNMIERLNPQMIAAPGRLVPFGDWDFYYVKGGGINGGLISGEEI